MGVSIYCGDKLDESLYEDGSIISMTHNLGPMATAAGLYECLWRPYRKLPNYVPLDESAYTLEMEFEHLHPVQLKYLELHLTRGLLSLVEDPKRFKAMNPANGWGTYDQLLEAVIKLLILSKEQPEYYLKCER